MARQSSLLGPTPKSAITVGYIDPTLGYIDNVSINDANKYAQVNPGTVFIFFDGNNNLRFLTITEVNSLTYSDLISTDKCNDKPQKCGPPIINFFGGGGVGASANPIIGADGSLLAVDVVSGGFGYKFPPKVSAEDLCQFGSGAVLRSSLGETATILETYEDEEDFEEYVIEEEEGNGIVEWGPDGEILGQWNADSYDFDNENDPIADEIKKYQKVLIEKPFWTTRKNKPSKITSLDESYNSYDVTHPSWNEFMNKYAISPVPSSDFSGSDYSGRVFTFEWIEEFPYDGQYTFKGLCDNISKVYLDDSLLVDNLNGFDAPVSSFSTNITEGFHVIRVDLLNIPIPQTSTPNSSSNNTQVSKINPKFIKKGKDFFIEVEGTGTGKVTILVDINDSPGIAGVAAKQIIIPSNDGDLKFTRTGYSLDNIESFVVPNESIKKTARFTGGKTYGPIKIIGASINVPEPEVKNNNKIALYDADGTDQNIQVTIADVANEQNSLKVNGIEVLKDTSNEPTSYQIPTVKFVQKNNQYYIQVSGNGEVKAKLKMDVNDSPYIADIAASEIILPTDTGNVSFKRTKLSQIDTFTSSFVSYIKEETITKNVSFTGGRLYGPIQILGSSSTQKINGSRRLDLYDLDGNDANIKFEIFSINPIKSKETSISVGTVISSASWNTNPMGISMSIDAPDPPIPVEPIPKQTGRCPSNPIWSTRFSGATSSWYPVKYEVPNTWSNFMNRYAVSPVPPSSDPGSDQSGITFSNTWNVNIPYDGFYALKGTADNSGKVYVDGILVTSLNGFTTNNPKINKVFLTKGPHTITVEVLNFPQDILNVIDKKIFSTQDWRSPAKSDFVDVVFRVYGEGRNSNKMKFSFSSEDNSSTFTINGAYSSGTYRKETIKVKANTTYKVVATSSLGTVEQGTISNGTKNKEGGLQNSNRIFGDRIASDNDNDDMQITVESGIFIPSNKRNAKNSGRSTYDLTFRVDSQSLTSVGNIGGVSYSGPPLFAHQDRSWSNNFMNNYSVSPKVFTDISQPENPVIGKYTLTWSNVDFPESGTYKINFQADNVGILKIDEQKIATSTDFSGNPVQYIANVTQGKHTVSVELENIERPLDNQNSFIFKNNPMGTAIHITKDVSVLNPNAASWARSNPIGVSAVLISPPCPKEIGGKGVVNEVIVEDPGNGYLPPDPTGQTYPVTLELADVIVTDPGINYNCGIDEIKIVPDNGAKLSYICDSFGRISDVVVNEPGIGFTSYPNIFMQSPTQLIGGSPTQPTGVNASFVPVFRVVRDPIEVPEDRLIQVTDLVGLKQTGYVDGRAYYGAVYYDNGVRYAGYYKTTGAQTIVYDTLQESITANIITPPSAIEVSGTDVSSNDPTLNIPRTLRTTTEL
jgi:hypothetical protein